MDMMGHSLDSEGFVAIGGIMNATKKKGNLPDNAIARKALETIDLIEQEAKNKKLAQMESLQSAKAAIHERLNELNHQLEQINDAIGAIKGEKATREKRTRRNLDGERDRVARWMEGRRGQRFGAGDLVREFPELDGTPISIFLKPLVENGKIKTDASEGIRRMKYFVEG
jgi:predicted nuclease with TOPRIM domain